MARALREYEVLGIETTVPFFRWMLDQPVFQAASFHTGYLDELLQQRQGEPFVSADPGELEAAAIAAALYLNSGSVPIPSARGIQPAMTPETQVWMSRPRAAGWKAMARAEALRG